MCTPRKSRTYPAYAGYCVADELYLEYRNHLRSLSPIYIYGFCRQNPSSANAEASPALARFVVLATIEKETA